MPSSTVDLFREEWLAASGDDMASRAARRSLEASAAGQPQLEAELAWLKMPTQAELDVHLVGPGVVGHQTAASAFGKFVQRTAEAVRQIASSRSRQAKGGAGLQVLAPIAGSVRVVFRSPDIRQVVEGTPAGFDVPSAHTFALERLVEIFALAESDDIGDSSTLAAVYDLNPAARIAISRTAKSILDASWELKGELRRRGSPPRALRVTTESATRVVRVIGEEIVEETSISVTGTIDGARQSTSVMWFAPDVGHPFAAAVSSDELMAEVRRIGAHAVPRAVASFTAYTAHAAGDGQPTRKQYVLDSIRATSESGSQEKLPGMDG